jgi:hypothetical protein
LSLLCQDCFSGRNSHSIVIQWSFKL